MDGSVIQSLENLEDGGFYVASSGENFKKVPYSVLGSDEQQQISFVSESSGEGTAVGVGGVVKKRHVYKKKPLQTVDEHQNHHEKERPLFGPTVSDGNIYNMFSEKNKKQTNANLGVGCVDESIPCALIC
jgi:hypothetical protein